MEIYGNHDGYTVKAGWTVVRWIQSLIQSYPLTGSPVTHG